MRGPSERWRDALTFGPWRRRRRLDAQLAALDFSDPYGGDTVPRRGLTAREERRLRKLGSRERSPRRHPYLRGWVTIALTAALVAGVVRVAPPDGLDQLFAGVGSSAPAPSTSGGTYAFLATQPDGSPVTYDPCRTLDVVVNPAQGPPDALALVREAVRTVSRVSGLDMAVTGTTDERPSAHRPTKDFGRYGLGYAPVLVAWATDTEVNGLAGDTAGLGGSVRALSITGGVEYKTGEVTLDAPAFEDIVARPGGHELARAIIMHELGHVLGLAHVASVHELMHGDNVGLVEFGSGDRTGLRLLGGRC